MTAYQRGAEFERRTKRHLEQNGYHVIRSAGSHSPMDLAAFKPTEILIVQCKINGRIGPAERHELTDLAARINATPVLAMKTERGHLTYRLITNADTRTEFRIDYAAPP